MSIIQAHHLESHASILQKQLQILRRSHDLLSFYEAVHNAQQALSELSSIVRTQEAKWSKCIPTLLLLQIFTFFPSSYLYRCRRVCSTWLDLLSSSESEEISRNLQRSRPQCIYAWSVDYIRRISYFQNELYICNLFAQIKVYSPEGRFIREFSTDYVTDGGITHEPSGLVVGPNYLSIAWPYCIGLFTSGGKLSQVWKRHCPGENMAIDSNLVYSSIGQEIIVYSVTNEFKRKWLTTRPPGRIDISGNELFALCGGNMIEVYSKEGLKIRDWPLSSQATEHMSVGKDLVCVSDGSWVSFYNRIGQPLFQWLEPDVRDVLLVGDDLLYVAFKSKIKAFHLF